MAQTPEEQLATMLANVPKKTGKTVDEWMALIAASGETKHGAIMKLLKGEHGVTHGFANLLSQMARQQAAGGPPAEEDLVANQYSGPKASLRPIYEALVTAVEQFGDDVVVSPKKTYVSLRRNKQFALVQPSTRTRVDVGINNKGRATTERLEASGSFNAMCSHRVRLTDATQVDDALIGWLREAYDAA